MRIKITSFVTEPNIEFYDFAGKVKNSIHIGETALDAKVINIYHGDLLISSFVYEIYPNCERKNILRMMSGGPYFFSHSGKYKKQNFIVIHSIFVVPEYRNINVFSVMLDEMLKENLPTYVYLWINKSLEKWFSKFSK